MDIKGWYQQRREELTKFAVVGALGVVVDAGVFNALKLGPLGPDDKVVTAKIIATLTAIMFAWVAHRLWTFRQRRVHHPARELVIFGLINGAALAIQAVAVAISHHGLGYTSVVADNVVAYAIALPIGTVIRYVAYRKFVFTGGASASG